MIFSAVCLVGMVFAILSTVIWFKKKNIIEAVTMGVIMWFFAHIFASMGLFVIDRYTVSRAGAGAALICGAVLGLVLFLDKGKFFRKRHTVGHEFSVKDMLIPIVIAVLAIPFVSQKNYFFGMGQDEGVYQTQAILFMNGDTKRQKTLEEYYDLTTEQEKEAFAYNAKHHLAGFDIQPEDYPDTVYDRSKGPASGIIHGIPTYSSLLATWGKLFGMEHMQDFETILYVCLIFLMYFISRNMKLKETTAACVCAASALAPVVIWVAKSSLTEMLLALIPAVFLYFMTDEDYPDHKWLSVIPVAVFGCYHVSLYTMIPMFVMIYGGMYVFTRQRQFAVLLPVTIAGYFASYLMMRHVQPMYTMNNYSPLFVGGITVHDITTVVIIGSAAAFAASLIFIAVVKKRTKQNFNPARFTRKASESKLFRNLLRVMLIIPVAFIAVKALLSFDSWEYLNHLTLWGFAGCTGLILFPLGLILAFVNVKYFAERQQRLVLFIMFFYCILVYSAFLRYQIQHYYYYSRYLAPFIPVAVLFCASAADRFGGKLLIPVTAVGLLYIAPFDAYLMGHKDDSRIEWSILEDIADFGGENDCIVISPKYTTKLWLPVRSMTGAKVVPEDENDAGQIDRLAARYGRVLVLTEKMMDDEDFSIIYSNRMHSIEDDLNHRGRIVPFSKHFITYDDDIRIYSYDKYRFMYTAAGDYAKMSGVSGLETYFCWTDSEEAQIECGLYPGDYDVTLELGCEMPLEAMGVNEVKVTMLLNGKEIGTDTITAENNGQPLHFSAGEEQVREGENILTICCPLWKAALSNPVDTRELGVPVKSVRFSSAA